jgi:hypothetical protein
VKNVGGMVDVIELLNEPAGFLGSNWAAAVRQFWLDGYGAVRQAAGAEIKVMIGNAFLDIEVCCSTCFLFDLFFLFLGILMTERYMYI